MSRIIGEELRRLMIGANDLKSEPFEQPEMAVDVLGISKVKHQTSVPYGKQDAPEFNPPQATAEDSAIDSRQQRSFRRKPFLPIIGALTIHEEAIFRMLAD